MLVKSETFSSAPWTAIVVRGTNLEQYEYGRRRRSIRIQQSSPFAIRHVGKMKESWKESE